MARGAAAAKRHKGKQSKAKRASLFAQQTTAAAPQEGNAARPPQQQPKGLFFFPTRDRIEEWRKLGRVWVDPLLAFSLLFNCFPGVPLYLADYPEDAALVARTLFSLLLQTFISVDANWLVDMRGAATVHDIENLFKGTAFSKTNGFRQMTREFERQREKCISDAARVEAKVARRPDLFSSVLRKERKTIGFGSEFPGAVFAVDHQHAPELLFISLGQVFEDDAQRTDFAKKCRDLKATVGSRIKQACFGLWRREGNRLTMGGVEACCKGGSFISNVFRHMYFVRGARFTRAFIPGAVEEEKKAKTTVLTLLHDVTSVCSLRHLLSGSPADCEAWAKQVDDAIFQRYGEVYNPTAKVYEQPVNFKPPASYANFYFGVTEFETKDGTTQRPHNAHVDSNNCIGSISPCYWFGRFSGGHLSIELPDQGVLNIAPKTGAVVGFASFRLRHAVSAQGSGKRQSMIGFRDKHSVSVAEGQTQVFTIRETHPVENGANRLPDGLPLCVGGRPPLYTQEWVKNTQSAVDKHRAETQARKTKKKQTNRPRTKRQHGAGSSVPRDETTHEPLAKRRRQ